MTMRQIATLALATMLNSVVFAQGTRLASDGKVLFQSTERVTFGASYDARRVRATVASPSEARVEFRVAETPRNVFVNGKRSPRRSWSYADNMVGLTVPSGTTEIQIRFDSVKSLKPVDYRVPVALFSNGRRQKVGDMVVTVADGNVSGQLNWPGPAGFYQPLAMLDGKPVADVSVAVREAPAATFGGAPACYLSADAVLTVSGDALAYELPLDSVDLKLAAACRDTVKVPKADLDWDGSVVVEGEAFSGEGGGEIQVSKEHGNTHGGACAFGWAKPGHWLEWTLVVPTDGDYVLTVVGASQETTILRSVDLDGKALAGAGVLRLEGTGGWGRVNPDEWQPYRPILDNGRPLRIRLAKGEHTLRLTNLVGQHFNVDAILLTPCK